ncbi:unnamed protein product [Rotaria sp. Silwood2]|nr:unnamed protein product [Rotaria sp. Silwood2]CAF2465137.1 unnamed protein product [Rotaria sp. Silwood2]CAF2854180.1 unnamed protein product [Rotaria sp. Silwood2]
MPSSLNANPNASSSLITVEKEPERDPEYDCFMCRQAHVYIKPIGMEQERRVARHHPPPLSRAQIDELSRKKNLTKQEARKLLQCYFPEIKNVKYFQLHKYHSCCYDPKHLNLCKNHITALQHEREQYHDHHQNQDEHNHNNYKDYEREDEPHNRVSFVRIKIEPTKGIPTRFLGPTALPESLAEMLIKQVNRLENKKIPPSFNSNQTIEPYNIRRVNIPHGSDDDNDEDDGDDDDDNEGHTDDDQTTHVKGKIMTESTVNYENNKQEKTRLEKKSTNGDLIVEDLHELNRLYVNHQDLTDVDENRDIFSKQLKKKRRKKGTKKKNLHEHHKSKLNHWELLALQQDKKDACNCRHHVMHLENNQVVYDWCRCKDHQHKELIERRKSIVLPPLLPSPPPPQQSTVPPPPPPPPKSRPKPRKVRKKSIGIDATEPTSTQLALAYDPSAVDYDMIQEVIYYRTASGRLIKPATTNAFTYDSLPSSMMINHQEPRSNKAEVLYMTPNGKFQPLEDAGRNRGKPKTIILSKPGSLYNGQALIDTEHTSSNNGNSNTMPVLKLPPALKPSRQHSRDNNKEYQPAEFTLAKFSSDKSVGTPDSEGKLRTVSMSMQKSTKPTYSNQNPTPDYGRESSVVANRRWFDQPLGDQNLRPVHDGQYGLIAGTSTDTYQSKAKLSENNNNNNINTKSDAPKNGSNCTIS